MVLDRAVPFSTCDLRCDCSPKRTMSYDPDVVALAEVYEFWLREISGLYISAWLELT